MEQNNSNKDDVVVFENKIFIIGPRTIELNDYCTVFAKYGAITDAITHHRNGRAVLTYSNAQEAARAVAEMNGQCILGADKPLRIKLWEEKPAEEGQSSLPKRKLPRSIFITVPIDFGPDKVREAFHVYGEITWVEICRDQETKELVGMAMVKFANNSQAEYALEHCPSVFAARWPRSHIKALKQEEKAQKKQQQQQQEYVRESPLSRSDYEGMGSQSSYGQRKPGFGGQSVHRPAAAWQGKADSRQSGLDPLAYDQDQGGGDDTAMDEDDSYVAEAIEGAPANLPMAFTSKKAQKEKELLAQMNTSKRGNRRKAMEAVAYLDGYQASEDTYEMGQDNQAYGEQQQLQQWQEDASGYDKTSQALPQGRKSRFRDDGYQGGRQNNQRARGQFGGGGQNSYSGASQKGSMQSQNKKDSNFSFNAHPGLNEHFRQKLEQQQLQKIYRGGKLQQRGQAQNSYSRGGQMGHGGGQMRSGGGQMGGGQMGHGGDNFQQGNQGLGGVRKPEDSMSEAISQRVRELKSNGQKEQVAAITTPQGMEVKEAEDNRQKADKALAVLHEAMEEVKKKDEAEVLVEAVMPDFVTESQTRQLFDCVPEMLSCRLNSKTHIARVAYSTQQCAEYAVKKLNNFEYVDTKLKVAIGAVSTVSVLTDTADVLRETVNALKEGKGGVQAVSAIMGSLKQIAGQMSASKSHVELTETYPWCSVNLPSMRPMVGEHEKVQERLFVMTVPQRHSEGVLRDVFCRFGNVIKVVFVQDRKYGFVHFADKAAADFCRKTLHRAVVMGMELRIEYGDRPSDPLYIPPEPEDEHPDDLVVDGELNPDTQLYTLPWCSVPLPRRQKVFKVVDGEQASKEFRLFVVAMPSRCSATHLNNIFSRFGNFINFRFQSGERYGFARFTSYENAHNCMETLRGQTVDGKKLKLELSNTSSSGSGSRVLGGSDTALGGLYGFRSDSQGYSWRASDNNHEVGAGSMGPFGDSLGFKRQRMW